MKKILLVTGLTLSLSTLGQSTFNKMAIDFGWGVNKAMSGAMMGVANKKQFSHFELAARYMATNKFGLAAGVVYEGYKTTIKNNDFTTSSFAIRFEGVLNFRNVLGLESFVKPLGVFGHSGPAFVFNTGKSSVNGSTYKLDKLASWTTGLTLQYKVAPKLSIRGDVSYVAYLKGNRSLDLQTAKRGGLTNGFDGTSAHMTIGVSYYLGGSADHADWTADQNGNPAEMEALKAKITKAEKDMMDDDKDGVPNYLDQEAGTAEGSNVNTKGQTVKVEKVVDMDGDGILDVNDFCPTIKGAASANGCPDKDGDNVYDFVDKCPNAAGLASDGGCPVVKAAEKATMEKAMKGVQFDNGKSTIIKKTLPILDEVAKVMIANPSYRLAIDGHTDNAGDKIKNLQLSDDRAKAVKAYLMSKGIAEGRMKATGYGDTKPKADNKTAKGKAANRRVEFIISFEQ